VKPGSLDATFWEAVARSWVWRRHIGELGSGLCQDGTLASQNDMGWIRFDLGGSYLVEGVDVVRLGSVTNGNSAPPRLTAHWNCMTSFSMVTGKRHESVFLS